MTTPKPYSLLTRLRGAMRPGAYLPGGAVVKLKKEPELLDVCTTQLWLLSCR